MLFKEKTTKGHKAETADKYKEDSIYERDKET